MEKSYLRKLKLINAKTLARFKYLKVLHYQIYLIKRYQNLIIIKHNKKSLLTIVLILISTLIHKCLKLNKFLS